MRSISVRLERPSFTVEWPSNTFSPVAGATFVRGGDISEPRAVLGAAGADGWTLQCLISRTEDDEVRLLNDHGALLASAHLHDEAELLALLGKLPDPLYLDITAMEHRTWAPIVRSLICGGRDFRVLYVKPQQYNRSVDPLPGNIWDLSHEIEGISPLPGFITISPREQDLIRFIPLLGFEGNRLEHILVAEDIDRSRVVPIVGSPGFRIEYPVETISANRPTLENDFVFAKQEYATASCPFDLFFLLEHLRMRYSDDTFVLAPIGTKPHALGAILHAIHHPNSTEIIYDHPRRRNDRTIGDGPVCEYDVAAFANEYLT